MRRGQFTRGRDFSQPQPKPRRQRRLLEPCGWGGCPLCSTKMPLHGANAPTRALFVPPGFSLRMQPIQVCNFSFHLLPHPSPSAGSCGCRKHSASGPDTPKVAAPDSGLAACPQGGANPNRDPHPNQDPLAPSPTRLPALSGLRGAGQCPSKWQEQFLPR